LHRTAIRILIGSKYDGLANESGIKNSPGMVKDGSLALHPNKREQNGPLRSLVKFTNSPIYKFTKKFTRFFDVAELSEGKNLYLTSRLFI
jgi:hypothetical protein